MEGARQVPDQRNQCHTVHLCIFRHKLPWINFFELRTTFCPFTHFIVSVRGGQDRLSRLINSIKISWYWLWFLRQYQYFSNTLYKIIFNIKIYWYWRGLNNQYQYSSNALFNNNNNSKTSWYYCGLLNQYQYLPRLKTISISISIFFQ